MTGVYVAGCDQCRKDVPVTELTTCFTGVYFLDLRIPSYTQCCASCAPLFDVGDLADRVQWVGDYTRARRRTWWCYRCSGPILAVLHLLLKPDGEWVWMCGQCKAGTPHVGVRVTPARMKRPSAA